LRYKPVPDTAGSGKGGVNTLTVVLESLPSLAMPIGEGGTIGFIARYAARKIMKVLIVLADPCLQRFLVGHEIQPVVHFEMQCRIIFQNTGPMLQVV
jgi:hypothetical protein